MLNKATAPARSLPRLILGFLSTLFIGAMISVQAASPSIWDGGGGDDYWSNPVNWGGNVPVPGSTYDLQFGGTTRLSPMNDFAAASAFRHVTFDNGAGAFLLGGNSITLSGNITNNSANVQTFSVPLAITAVRTVVPVSGDLVFGGPFSGAGGLTIAGSGAVTLNSRNTFAGATTINGILNLPAGGSINNAANFIIGNSVGHNGALNITGGAVTNTQATGTGNFMVGRAGFGSLNLSSGTVRVNQVYVGWTQGTGTALIDGGSLYCGTGNDYVVIGNSDGTGVLTVNAGLLYHAVANRSISLNNNGVGRGEINVLGGTLDNSGGAISFGYNTALATVGTGSGIVNLNGGNLRLNRFVNQKQNYTGPGDNGFSYLNFNGGILTASASTLTSPTIAFSSNFIPAAIDVRVNGAFGAHAGGAVINTDGQDCLVDSPLLAPTGDGVSALTLAEGGSGYTGAPYVSISGDGIGATAIANMVDDGTGKGTFKIASLTVCNPGVNYTAAATSFSLFGGAPVTAATLHPSAPVTTVANTSGGLTKLGAGTLTLNGANTYTGTTVVEGGRLILSSAHAGGGNVMVKDGAAFGAARDPVTTALLSPSLTVGTTAGAELDFVIPDVNPATPLMIVGTLVLNGTTTVGVSGANLDVGPQFPLIKYTTLVGNPASITNGVLNPPKGTRAWLVHNPANSSFDLVITAVARQLKWAGTINSGGVGVWDDMITANWLNPDNSARTFLQGSDVTFDDTAPGVSTVGVVGDIAPNSITADNSSKTYTINGTGSLIGSLSLTKTNSGTLTLANASTHAGSVAVNGGTLAVASSLATDGPVTVDGGTLASSGAITGSGSWSVGGTESARGTINITAGSDIQLAGGLILGNNASGSGAVNIFGGVLTNTQTSSASNFEIGFTGYGGLNMSGGDVKVNTFYVGGNSGIGVASISGGNFYCGTGNDYLLVGGVNLGTGVLTVSGGLLSHASANRLISINNNSDGRGELNLLGGVIDNAGGGVGYGYNPGGGLGTGIVNINGGNLVLNRFVNTKQGPSLLTGNAWLNLNGGTLTASPSTLTSPNLAFSRSFIPARMEVRVNGTFGTFPGGAIIDTAGQTCLVESALLAPTGDGIRTLAVVDGGSGYIGAPYVSIVGDGTGANAIANMVDDGTGKGTLKVGSITVCNPGVNYTAASTYYTLNGGGPMTPATPGNLTTAPNTSGGLTKMGSGTLTLAGLNTYMGATVVNGGTLLVSGSLDAASAVTVAGGSLGGGDGSINGPVNVLAGGALAPGGTLAINNTLALATGSTTFVRVDASSSTSDLVQGITTVNYGGTLVISNTAGTLVSGQTFQLFSALGHNNDFAKVQSAGGAVTWSFNPASGIATVVSTVATTSTNMSYSLNGATLGLTWPESHQGWYAQSNSLSVANAGAWYDVPDSQLGTSLTITVNPAMSNVFYRLRQP